MITVPAIQSGISKRDSNIESLSVLWPTASGPRCSRRHLRNSLGPEHRDAFNAGYETLSRTSALFAANVGYFLKILAMPLLTGFETILASAAEIGAGRTLQHILCRAAKNDPVCFVVKEIYHQRARRHVPHC